MPVRTATRLAFCANGGSRRRLRCGTLVVGRGAVASNVAQAAVEVRPGDTADGLHERIKIEERRLLVGTVSALARDGATVSGREVTIP